MSINSFPDDNDSFFEQDWQRYAAEGAAREAGSGSGC